ncbi:DUF5908 family protein [Pseudomonas syringae]|uniref:Uncharacterized protein n=1 Tax=Pseudomonas syringae TaxID=317 RepID=A0A9Q4A607_PSESX|nr:DUF5908 family protein [Pseudomonas syringae]MCF5467837.1 hypothetical protein [Pseudomonas syringae]MCF5472362.1 hypothetical protein [Pseudomonas syringae]MCF5481660.1 hypothetical protein [Pseudomonas syringae]MCF5488097.1 hypothetical protein [Pseudomonas syringae]MCF5494018.1 hypothetical protein [Pseudomonas syringae]
MPVEIRELVIHTRIISRNETPGEVLSAERIASLRKSIVQECLRALKDKAAKTDFDR